MAGQPVMLSSLTFRARTRIPIAAHRNCSSRKKAAQAKRSRQEETRRKVLVGAVVLAKLEDGTYPETEFTAMMDAALTRAEDRRLFGLAVGEPEAPTEAKSQM